MMIEATIVTEPSEFLTREQIHLLSLKGNQVTYKVRRSTFERNVDQLSGVGLYVLGKGWSLYPRKHRLGVIQKVEKYNKKSVSVTVSRNVVAM